MTKDDIIILIFIYYVNFSLIRLTFKDTQNIIRLERQPTNVLPFRRYTRLKWLRKKRGRQYER